jgi:hypothetical protein
MTLEVELVGGDVSITLAPDTDVEMATFGRYFPEAEITPGGGGETLMLQIVKIKIGRSEFQQRLKPLGLQESGDATKLRVTSTAGADARYHCLRLDPRHSPTECQNLTAADRGAAELACELMARANNWFGGQVEEGSCGP